MPASVGNTGSENVRHYFTKLALTGQRRAALGHWSTLPVETFFVALRLSDSELNVERRPAARALPSLGALFAEVRW